MFPNGHASNYFKVTSLQSIRNPVEYTETQVDAIAEAKQQAITAHIALSDPAILSLWQYEHADVFGNYYCVLLFRRRISNKRRTNQRLMDHEKKALKSNHGSRELAGPPI